MKKFNWRLAFLIGLSGVIGNTIWVIFNNYVPILLQTGHPLWEGVAGESTAVVGFALAPTMAYFIMTWDNIIHMFLTPWAGARSDKTWTRFGRRLPWVMVGVPIAVIGFILVPYVTSLVAIILAIMLTNIGTGIYRAPIRAWMGDFFEPADRTKAEVPVHVVGGVTSIIAALIGGYLFDQGYISAPFLIASGFTLLGGIALAIWLKEDKELQIGDDTTGERGATIFETLGQMRLPKNRSVLYAFLGTFLFHMGSAAYQAGVSGFAVFDIGMGAGRVGQFVAIAGILYIILAFPSGLLANRVGPRRIMMLGMLIYGLAHLWVLFFVNTEQGLLIGILISGIAWSMVFLNSLPLFMNTDTGKNFGVFAGIYYLAFQAASIVGPLLSGALVQGSGSQRAMWIVSSGGMLLAFFALMRVSDRDFADVEAVLASD